MARVAVLYETAKSQKELERTVGKRVRVREKREKLGIEREICGQTEKKPNEYNSIRALFVNRLYTTTIGLRARYIYSVIDWVSFAVHISNHHPII